MSCTITAYTYPNCFEAISPAFHKANNERKSSDESWTLNGLSLCISRISSCACLMLLQPTLAPTDAPTKKVKIILRHFCEGWIYIVLGCSILTSDPHFIFTFLSLHPHQLVHRPARYAIIMFMSGNIVQSETWLIVTNLISFVFSPHMHQLKAPRKRYNTQEWQLISLKIFSHIVAFIWS